MNKTEIAQLLTVASGFDRRVVDKITVEAWFLVPGIQQAEYADALDAVIAHQTTGGGAYLTVGHVVDATSKSSRQTKETIAADVRSARARGLIGRDWPETQPVSSDVRDQLARMRSADRDYAKDHPPEIGHWDGNQDYNNIGRTA